MKQLYALTLTSLLLISVFSGCSPKTNTPEKEPAQTEVHRRSPEAAQLIHEGDEAYTRFDYDRAIELYSQALTIDANDYAALSGAGVALAMRGNATGSREDVQKGIQKIERALTVNPDDTSSFYNLALAYKIAGRTDEAVTWFQKVIDKDPQNTWSYYGIATIYGDRGNAEKAVEYLQKAMATDEENVRNAAASQSHFDAVRNDSRFRKLIYKE